MYHAMNIPTKFGSNWPGGFRKEDKKNRHLWASGFFVVYFRSTNKLFLEDHPMNIHSKFGFNWFGDFREEDKNVQVYWQKKSRLQVMTLPHTTLLIRWAKNIDWVAQTSIIYKCQLKLYWHLNLFKMYMTLIYICATQSLPKT